MKQHSRFVLLALAFGYAFLYIPLIFVIVYSFNDSRIATIWRVLDALVWRTAT